MHGYFQVNQSIHQKIVEASRNAALLATYANFAGPASGASAIPPIFARKRERWGEAMREHENDFGRRCGAAPAANSLTSCSTTCATSAPPRSSI